MSDTTNPQQPEPEKQPEHEPNVHCAWCKEPIGYEPLVPTGKVSHGICKRCQKHFFQELTEDWTFEPTKDTNLPARNVRFTMSNVSDIKPKDSALPDYKQSTDKSHAQSEKMRKLYRAMNNAYARPATRLPLGY